MSQTDQTHVITRTRGIWRIRDPRVWKTIIGATVATVFVLVNRGALDEQWQVVAISAWALSLLSYREREICFRRAHHHPGGVHNSCSSRASTRLSRATPVSRRNLQEL